MTEQVANSKEEEVIAKLDAFAELPNKISEIKDFDSCCQIFWIFIAVLPKNISPI